MKKIFIILFAVLTIFGLRESRAQFDFGVVAGMNLSKADFKGDLGRNFDSKNRCGWFVGPKVGFTIPLIGIGLDASLQYSQRYINAESNGYETTKTLKTFEIPVNLKYQFGLKSIAAIYVATGPQFGFNVGSRSFEDYKVKNSVLSWNVGAGVRLLKHLEVGVGYNIALSKFAKVTGTQGSVKANSFQAHLGYYF